MKRLIFLIFVAVFSLQPAAIGMAAYPTPDPVTPSLSGTCHFGIAAPYPPNPVDLSLIGVDTYLNWAGEDWEPGYKARSERTNFIRMVIVRSDIYEANKSMMARLATTYPGSTWSIGNEPDERKYQDSVTAEVYARRFFELATIIRANDPKAKIGFGTVVQPTPIRMRYLDRALNELADLAGSPEKASALIDFWSIHAFILNEEVPTSENPYPWGCSIPTGFDGDSADAIKITFADTYSIDVFKQRIQAFRTWMKARGEQNKPLWISEYGSLFPSIKSPFPKQPLAIVSDELSRDFMLATFDYMLSAKDPEIGYAPDENRLIQKTFWYSLNDFRYDFGGSLFDQVSNNFTEIGKAFINYDPPAGSVTPVAGDAMPISLTAIPQKYVAIGAPEVDYRLIIRVDNLVRSDLPVTVTVNVYQDRTFIGTATGRVNRCGGGGLLSLPWHNQVPNGVYNLQVEVILDGDTNPGNNTQTLQVTTSEPVLTYVPLVAVNYLMAFSRKLDR